MHLALAPAAFLALASTALASDLIVPISQVREVEGRASADDFVTFLSDSDIETATNFGLFSAAAAANVTHPDCLAAGGGTQTSDVLADSITATGSCFSNSESYNYPWLAEAYGRSEARVRFTLTAGSDYAVTGTIAAYDFGDTVVVLRDSSGAVIDSDYAIGPSGQVNIALTGTLAAGVYEFQVRTNGSTYANSFQYDYASGDYDVRLDFTPLSGNYCPASPNSAGPGAALTFSGSQEIAGNDFQLEVTSLTPNGFGYFFYGATQQIQSQGNGTLCIGTPLFRLSGAVPTDGAGAASLPVDFTTPPTSGGPGQILAMSTWNFQWIYRDTLGAGFNLSEGLWVQFRD